MPEPALRALAADAAVAGAVHLADSLLEQRPVLQSKFAWALFDNGVHAAIAAYIWWRCSPTRALRQRAAEALFCAAASSCIDADHFFAARSLHLGDALALGTERPPLHSTLVLALIVLVAAAIARVLPAQTNIGSAARAVPWMLSVAFFTHHLRDAYRRGFWLYPLPFTVPIRRSTYLVVLAILPTLVALLQPHLKRLCCTARPPPLLPQHIIWLK
eukprot:m.5235 g.5235  ORF g.5235 m.5235 type:complete len:216 (+) comp2491_c0_seq1:67-714(+)